MALPIEGSFFSEKSCFADSGPFFLASVAGFCSGSGGAVTTGAGACAGGEVTTGAGACTGGVLTTGAAGVCAEGAVTTGAGVGAGAATAGALGGGEAAGAGVAAGAGAGAGSEGAVGAAIEGTAPSVTGWLGGDWATEARSATPSMPATTSVDRPNRAARRIRMSIQ